MTCEQARQYLWRKPFQPVRIRLKDGRIFDVLASGMTLAAEAILIIGIPPADDPGSRYSDRSEWVRWPDVDAIKPLYGPALPTTSPQCELGKSEKPLEHSQNGGNGMTCEQARQYLWRKPFQPVRIRLKDGRTFDVRHRGWTLAAEAILIIGIPPAKNPNSRYSDRGIWVRWPDVDAIEPLSEPAAPAV